MRGANRFETYNDSRFGKGHETGVGRSLKENYDAIFFLGALNVSLCRLKKAQGCFPLGESLTRKRLEKLQRTFSEDLEPGTRYRDVTLINVALRLFEEQKGA